MNKKNRSRNPKIQDSTAIQNKKDLKADDRMYRMLVEDIPAMICRFKPDGKLTLANNHFCDHFGVQGKNPDEYNFFDCLPDGRRKTARSDLWSLTSENPVIIHEYEMFSGDGRRRWYEWIHHGLFEDREHPVEYQSIGLDITDRKKEETQRKAVEKQLMQSQKLEAIGTLAGGFAHDFNNILGSILGYAQMMEMFDMEPDSPLQSSLQEIIKAGNRAKDLVEQILIFSRRDTSGKTPVLLSDVIRDSMKMLRPSLPSTIILEHDIPPGIGRILGNTAQIQQVLFHLFTNAAEAMTDGGGLIRLTLGEFDTIEKKGYAVLKITDTGPGIDPEIIDRIFDPFFTSKKNCGTGLGLSVVHGIIKEHEGEIFVRSDAQAGTCFEIRLPLTDRDVVTVEEESDEITLTGNERILFIDDEPPLVKLGIRSLENLGYRISGFTDSVEAFETFRKNPEAFDLVVSDMTMPYMTGLDIARKIRILRRDIPIIICTGHNKTLTDEGLERIGIDKALKKPVSIEELAKKIRSLL